jgi:signal transduction histidine kinase
LAYADPNAIRIVIHNFLTNAIKFSYRDGVIKINAGTSDGDEVNFSMADEGVGMPPEFLSNLFKTQVTSAAGTENEIGTGMGLLFCRDLIQNQCGSIWAESVAGKGTVIGFRLSVGKIER